MVEEEDIVERIELIDVKIGTSMKFFSVDL
jgi:hypothetical protein